jgi:hypothetical protein
MKLRDVPCPERRSRENGNPSEIKRIVDVDAATQYERAVRREIHVAIHIGIRRPICVAAGEGKS